MTARTKGYVESVKRQPGSVSHKTAEGAIATHVGASNDNGVMVEGTVKAMTTTSNVLASARLVLGNKTVVEVQYLRSGIVKVLDMGGTEQPVEVHVL